MSQYYLGSVGRQKKFGEEFFLHKKSMKIIQNTLKIEEKFSDVPKILIVGPQKSRVGRVSGNKIFFFFRPKFI